jgi:hypothetical protein
MAITLMMTTILTTAGDNDHGYDHNQTDTHNYGHDLTQTAEL